MTGLGGPYIMTTQTAVCVTMLSFGTCAALAVPVSAQAQDGDAAAIEALIDGASSPDKALAMARQQAQSGDITGATATLERVLLTHQDAHDVRIFYAGLLCQLDDPQGARVEVTKLDKQAIDDKDWNAANAACGGALIRPAAAQPASPTGFAGEAYVGLAYDGDALGPLITQLDLPGVATPTQSGLGLIAGVRGAYKSPAYFDTGGLYAGGSIRGKRSVDGPAQKYMLADIRLGYGRQSSGGRQSNGSDYAVGVVLRHSSLFGNAYVTEYGGQAELGFKTKGDNRIALRGEAVYQDYAKLGPGKQGQGWRFDLSASFEKPLSETSFITTGAAVELKEGKVKEASYTGARIFAAYRGTVGDKGHYFNLSSTLRRIDFKDRPPVLDRKDTRFFARGAYGLPLGKSGVKLEGAVSYTSRSITNRATVNPAPPFPKKLADYGSFGAEVRLLWKF